jgi:ElaB/YqjD/DUF883 family membrane-anchored ribosome-binding protein
MSNRMQEAADATSREFGKGMNDASKMAGRASDAVQDGVTTARNTLSDIAHSTGSALDRAGIKTDEIADAAMKKGSELQEALMAEIKSRPLRALAVAFGAGLLVSMMSRSS